MYDCSLQAGRGKHSLQGQSPPGLHHPPTPICVVLCWIYRPSVPCTDSGLVYLESFPGLLCMVLKSLVQYPWPPVWRPVLDGTPRQPLLDLNHAPCGLHRVKYVDRVYLAYPSQDLLRNTTGEYVDTNQPSIRCECKVYKELSGYNKKDTYLYYGLENFYQNHRRYVDSRSDPQLRNVQLEATVRTPLP